MLVLISIMLLISLVGLVVGIIKPELVLRWVKESDNINRKNVVKYFGLSFLILFIVGLAITPSTDTVANKNTDDTSHISEEVVEEVEEAEEEKEEEEVYKMEDKGMETLSKPYSELTDYEKSFVEEVEKKLDKVVEEDREKVSTELSRLITERDEYERQEKEKAEAEKQARLEEEQARLEKEKAERYETGITWEDIARDKDGLIGSYVRLSGKVIQVIDGDEIVQCRLAVNNSYDKVVLVEILRDTLDKNILEDDLIVVEGMSMGNMKYTTVMGAERSIPAILVENVRYQ